jgi:hypothetical protein
LLQYNASGFSADYVALGPRANELKLGTGRLLLCIRSAATVIADDESDGETPDDPIVDDSRRSEKKSKKTAVKAPPTAKRPRTADPSPSDEWMDVDDVPPRVERIMNGITKAPKSSNVFRKGAVNAGAVQRYNGGDSYLETPVESTDFLFDAQDPVRKRTYHAVFDDDNIDDADEDNDFILKQTSRAGMISNKTLAAKSKPIMIEDSDDDITVEGYGIVPAQASSTSAVVSDQSSGAASSFEKGKVLSRAQKKLFARWLEEYRKRWASYWNYMDNTVVNAIVNTVPQTIEELSQLPKFGQSKAEMWGEHILATIWSFLNTHYLLEYFPILGSNPPTIKDCPTWRDPLSAEADTVRSASATSNTAKAKPLAPIEDSPAISSTLFLARPEAIVGDKEVVGSLLDELKVSEDPRSWAWDSAAVAPPLIQSPPKAFTAGFKDRENLTPFVDDSFAIPSIGSMKNIYSSLDSISAVPSTNAYQHYTMPKGINSQQGSPAIVPTKAVISQSPFVPPPSSLPHSPYY